MTAIINMHVSLSVRGSNLDVRIPSLYCRRQILTFKHGPAAEGVKRLSNSFLLHENKNSKLNKDYFLNADLFSIHSIRPDVEGSCRASRIYLAVGHQACY